MKKAAQNLQTGNAALFLLIRKMTTDKVLAALQGEGGTVTRTSFDESKEAGPAPSACLSRFGGRRRATRYAR